ncbi:MAG TPA: molecular chaperone HtpG [Saprospiraceae bacterium]|nr:molecular chaperone HtpG [Saprospirales bacterium]HRQ30000.1 molecular chaperone HtpG [Saprospiraceae bacterium]
MQKGQIDVKAHDIFPLIKKFLYSDQEIFLRELISNGIDATTKLKVLASKDEFKEELGDLTIDIRLDEEAKTLTISDRGVGMTGDEVIRYLNQVAFSSAQEFMEKYKSDDIIGHFGLGFYSAFMVAEKVEVVTKSYKDGSQAVKWTCEGQPDFTLEDVEKVDRGTDVILHIGEEGKEYLKKARIQELLDKYSKFLPVLIRFGTKTEYITEGEGKDSKQVEKEVENIINNPYPAWKKAPADLTDDDYKAFYQELYPYSPEPVFWIHLNMDYPFNLTGILYFPKLNNSVEIQKNKIQLYSNQVFVTDDVKTIVPEFLTLLHGVIDSPDIPLNVSRSHLQSDSNVKKITSYITKKVGEKLADIFKENRKDFEEKWKDLSTFIKYGMISEEKFYTKAEKFALFQNVEGGFFTIDEYLEKIKDIQTNKHDRKIIIYTSNEKAQHAYVQSAKKEGYDVLVMDNILDNHFMQHLEMKVDKITFVRVDSETIDKLVEKDTERESVLSEKNQEKVKEIFRNALGDHKEKIELKAMSPEDMPVVITKPEFMRRMMEMQAMQGGQFADFPEMYQIVVNTNHPLIADKLINMRNEEKKVHFAKYLQKLALLNQNMLTGEEMSEFVHMSVDMLKQ